MIRTAGGKIVQIGDFAAVATHNPATAPIEFGEWLYEHGTLWNRPDPTYQHAIAAYLGNIPSLGEDCIMEAEARGAVIVPYHYKEEDVLWSTENPHLDLTDGQRAQTHLIAHELEGLPYGWFSYPAMAIHRLHIPFPFLKWYMQSHRSAICSALADLFRQQYHPPFQLFDDGRWNGFVDPYDIGEVIRTYGYTQAPRSPQLW